MRAFDFSPLLRSTVGFENLNRLVDFASRIESGDVSYPPYNIEKLGEDAYRISMAVAGFSRDELDVTVKEDVLIVTGQSATPDEERTFLHRGIAKRAFERRFQLADSIKVTGAALADGLLNIALKREVPEHKKPRQIAISSEAPGKAQILEGEKAA
ncbi:MAG: Hsp20 family protein [Pseudomonadota bacterium]